MEALRGAAAPDRTVMDAWARPCAMALAVAMALGLSGCGGGGGGNSGGGNVRPAPPATSSDISVEGGQVTVRPDTFSGSTSLVKNGAGTLTLTGASSHTGGTTVNQGILQIGNGGTSGSIQGNVTNNASLVFNRSDDISFAGAVSGSGSLTQQGTGTLILTGASTYTGGTMVNAGTLKLAAGATLGAGDITVGDRRSSSNIDTSLQVGRGVALSNRILLQGRATLINAGALGGNVGVAVSGENIFGSSYAVLNQDGGSIRGSHAGIAFNGYPGSIANNGGGTIQGGDVATDLSYGGSVSNEGVGSTISSGTGLAVQAALATSTVRNSAGGVISGGAGAIRLQYGGSVTNEGAGSSILSSNGIAIEVTGQPGAVTNGGGATISAAATAVYLQHGGSVTNDAGSTIASTGTRAGDCPKSGGCAIFVASEYLPAGNAGGALVLTNAGTIIGDVKLRENANNAVLLSAGSSIRGDLDVGVSSNSTLTLTGAAGSVRSYAQTVTGKSRFYGDMTVANGGTWVIDNDNLIPRSVTIDGTGPDGTTLQIGDGGSKGSLGLGGNIAIHSGTLVFNRSDDVTFASSISSVGDGALIHAGSGKLTLVPWNQVLRPSRITIERGTLQIDNSGDIPGSATGNFSFEAPVLNKGALLFNSARNVFASGAISGPGSVTQNGPGELILQSPDNTYTGGTTINQGSIRTAYALPGNVKVNGTTTLEGYANGGAAQLAGVAGDLYNSGRVVVRGGDTHIGGSYTNTFTGTLAVSLGSKLVVDGNILVSGGTLEIIGADQGYVANSHTEVFTTTKGISFGGSFTRLAKAAGVVFTSSRIYYDSHSAWLDTTGLDVTTAAAGGGVTYTPLSLGSAQRVQGAFTQLNSKIASGNLSSVSSDFVQAAGEFQQAPNLEAAQASLQSLSGQLHAASAAMTFEAIDASSRALADRFDDLLGRNTGYGMWTQSLNVGGGMGRSGYDGVGFQLNGWLVGSDRKIGSSGVAGFVFGQNQGQQQLDQAYDRNRSRSTEGMLYAGWVNGNWYAQGRLGVGHFQQSVNRRLLLGSSLQGVSTDYSGNYNVAYGETGLHLNLAGSRITPFASVEYASIDRDGFAEQGAGGFGLRTNAQMLDRWRAGLGLRAARHWDFAGGRAVDFSASVQLRRTLASHGDAFDASFVGLQQWQPLVGIGLSRYSGVLNLGLNATLSKRTSLRFNYDYEKGQRDQAQTLSTNLFVAS